MQNNKEVVLNAVRQKALALLYSSYYMRNDKEVVLAAVKQGGYALYFASDELKNDKDVVLAAVKQNKRSFQYASDELKNDEDVIFAATGKHNNKKDHSVYKKINANNVCCLIGLCEIKEGDLYYKCSHYYLKENFDKWKKHSAYSNKCIYCFEKIINTIFINKDLK